jgi:hypothetical protein
VHPARPASAPPPTLTRPSPTPSTPHLLPQPAQVEAPQVDAVQGDAPRGRVVVALDQPHNGRLRWGDGSGAGARTYEAVFGCVRAAEATEFPGDRILISIKHLLGRAQGIQTADKEAPARPPAGATTTGRGPGLRPGRGAAPQNRAAHLAAAAAADEGDRLAGRDQQAEVAEHGSIGARRLGVGAALVVAGDGGAWQVSVGSLLR